MSDEERELVPSKPAETPSATDIPPAEAVDAPPSAAIDEVMPAPPPVEAEAPSVPDGESEQDAANATRALSSREIDEPGFADWLRTCSSRLRVPRPRTVAKATTKRRKKAKKK